MDDDEREIAASDPRHFRDLRYLAAEEAALRRMVSRRAARRDGRRPEIVSDLLADVAAAERGLWAEARALRDGWNERFEMALMGRKANSALGALASVLLQLLGAWAFVGFLSAVAIRIASWLLGFEMEPLLPLLRWLISPVYVILCVSFGWALAAFPASLVAVALRPDGVRIARAHDDRSALVARLARCYAPDELRRARDALATEAARAGGVRTVAEGSAASVAGVFALIEALRGGESDWLLASASAAVALVFALRVQRAVQRARRAGEARDAAGAALKAQSERSD